jgi:hypothetical protein
MNCKQARGKLALMIGNDLDVSAVGDVQKHLRQCTGCRQHLQQLSSCLEVLQVPAAGVFPAEGESLWPRISVRLAAPAAGQRPHRLSGWGPTLAVAASCAAMFWVASYQFGGGNSPVSTPFRVEQPIELQPVDGPPDYEHQARPNDFRPDSSRVPDGRSNKLMRDPGTVYPATPISDPR